ncbi:MAG: amino acid ABC transporter substrate-binding protein [Deltaproteobacteria bacterium]|nr:amino acid ABC transporter substrate-binding protein [Deltaproteobacteria bacterium]
MTRALVLSLIVAGAARAQPEDPPRPQPLPYVPPAPGYEPAPEPAPLPEDPPAPVVEQPAPVIDEAAPEPEPVEPQPGPDPELADAWRQVEPRTIGVLLPLTGAQDKLGRAARDAIELALAPLGLRVLVRDTGSDPARAAEEARRLVAVDRVTALLGPIARAECEASAAVSRRFVVPHVVLASVVPPAADAAAPDPVRRFRTSPAELARALARHARLALAVERVAIVHPTSLAGRESARAFAEAFAELGGTVVKVIDYPAGALPGGDLMPTLMDAKRRGKKVVAGFDAVVVPDQGAAGLRLAGELAAWGVPLRMGPGAAAGRVQVLGLNGFATPLLVDHVTALTDNAVFAEPWAAAVGDPTFVLSFMSKHGRPPVAFHAEAFDAATWLGRAVVTLDGGDQTLRLAVASALSADVSWLGATGTVTVSAGRVAPRAHLLTLQGASIRPRASEDEELRLRAPPPEPTATGSAP